MLYQLLGVLVVLDTTKVQIFKQITTDTCRELWNYGLFQIPQRYRFSSKSQQVLTLIFFAMCCFRYHKGTDFQANHNTQQRRKLHSVVVLDTTKVQIFKQITTCYKLLSDCGLLFQIPQRYRFSSKSQLGFRPGCLFYVVLDTTKVQIFKQITTGWTEDLLIKQLFQIPQRYRFSSKSQLLTCAIRQITVVLDTTKVQIFKQITTTNG